MVPLKTNVEKNTQILRINKHSTSLKQAIINKAAGNGVFEKWRRQVISYDLIIATKS